EEARGTLDRAFAQEDHALRSDDGWKRRQLVSASEEVESAWGIVMLMPNGPYERGLRALVEQLEQINAEEVLPSDERILLTTAQSILSTFDRNPRRSSDDWTQLEA